MKTIICAATVAALVAFAPVSAFADESESTSASDFFKDFCKINPGADCSTGGSQGGD